MSLAEPLRQTRERRFEVNGLAISGLSWGDPGETPLLALHGWLDNAASFACLAPLLHCDSGPEGSAEANLGRKALQVRGDGLIVAKRLFEIEALVSSQRLLLSRPMLMLILF